MKKINLSGIDGIIEKVSKFEFLLLEVAVLLFVFIVVQQTPQLEAFETRNLSSLSVSWDRPTGYASFIDAGKKQAFCTGSTSCATAKYTYWPGSSIIYSVKVKDRTGAVFADGTTKADTYGRAKASWTWKYAVAVWPNNFVNCLDAGGECKTQSLTNNNSTNNVTFGELKPNTDYHIIVCSPNCGSVYTGGVVVDRVQRTAIPATLVNPPTLQCDASTGKVNVVFNWTPPSGASFDQVWLDFSLDENFAAGYTQSQAFMPTDSTYSRADFAPNQLYYWRVNARIAGTANAWVTSATGPFKTGDCNPPAPIVTCVMADVNHSGDVNSTDYQLIKRQETLPYDPKYDIDKNGKVEDADILWAASKAGTCSPVPYATRLSQSTACTSLGPGNLAKVTFNWKPATNTYSEQFLDFDVYPHGDVGWPASIAKAVSVGTGTITLDNFAQETVYYWRINTKVDGVWQGSVMKQFITPKCYSPTEPKDLNVVMGVSTKNELGQLCTDSPYAVVFRWSGTGSPWYLDVSLDKNFQSSNVHTRDVSGKIYLITNGDQNNPFTPTIKFEPGKTYWWRMYSQQTGKWYLASIPAFYLGYCNPPTTGGVNPPPASGSNEVPSGDMWPVGHGHITQGTRCCLSHGDLDAIDIENNTNFTSLNAGTPLVSTIDGYVAEVCVAGGSCNYGSLGNAVVVKNQLHETKVIYAHMLGFNVQLGDPVSKGMVVGYMGATGYATGVHLHYEFRGLPMAVPYIPQTGSTDVRW